MDKITGIRAVSFDADGTLWDFDALMRRSLKYTLAEFQRIDAASAGKIDVETMIEIREQVGVELKGKVINLDEVRQAAFRRTLEYIGRPDEGLASHLNKVYLGRRYQDMELFDDVLPTLESLRDKYVIGMITNGNSDPARCGLDGIFQFTIFSQDWGVEKPDAKIFRIAAEHAGCAEVEMLHVGDSLENDVMGALNAGMRSVWLNRDGADKPLDLRPDYEASSLLELRDILGVAGNDASVIRHG